MERERDFLYFLVFLVFLHSAIWARVSEFARLSRLRASSNFFTPASLVPYFQLICWAISFQVF